MTGMTFQSRVAAWCKTCFGDEIAADVTERNHRFLEEALELVQSLGCTKEEAQQLVDYTFSRDLGEPAQEVGGVTVTLAALCAAHGIDMHVAAEDELHRVEQPELIEKIRRKQAAKPKFSPLPGQPESEEKERAIWIVRDAENGDKVFRTRAGAEGHFIACVNEINPPSKKVETYEAAHKSLLEQCYMEDDLEIEEAVLGD